MIGLALVSAFGVLAASTNASVDRLVDQTIGADYVVSDAVGAAFGTEVARSVSAVDGVDTVVRQRFGPARVDGDDVFLSAIDTEGLSQAVKLHVVAGSLAGLDRGLLVDEATAESRGWSVGDTVPVTFLSGGERRLTLGGIYQRSQALDSYAVSLDTWEAAGGDRRDQFVYVTVDPGADTDAVGRALEEAVAAYPTVALKDQVQFKEQQKSQVNQLLSLIYGLLALAIVIAVLGIVNTLALSVIERTREIGLLRAVGMSRRQLRSMVRLESVVISLFGAVLGVVLGIGFGTALQRVLAGEGIEVLSIPYGSLAVFLLLAAVVGVLAAVWPARRAARLDVLRAITTE
jgi:putative ABC transport system permease protein